MVQFSQSNLAWAQIFLALHAVSCIHLHNRLTRGCMLRLDTGLYPDRPCDLLLFNLLCPLGMHCSISAPRTPNDSQSARPAGCSGPGARLTIVLFHASISIRSIHTYPYIYPAQLRGHLITTSCSQALAVAALLRAKQNAVSGWGRTL